MSRAEMSARFATPPVESAKLDPVKPASKAEIKAEPAKTESQPNCAVRPSSRAGSKIIRGMSVLARREQRLAAILCCDRDSLGDLRKAESAATGALIEPEATSGARRHTS